MYIRVDACLCICLHGDMHVYWYHGLFSCFDISPCRFPFLSFRYICRSLQFLHDDDFQGFIGHPFHHGDVVKAAFKDLFAKYCPGSLMWLKKNVETIVEMQDIAVVQVRANPIRHSIESSRAITNTLAFSKSMLTSIYPFLFMEYIYIYINRP